MKGKSKLNGLYLEQCGFQKGMIPKNINQPNVNPSRELAYLIGVIRGDGFITINGKGRRKTYRIGLNVINKKFIQYFRDVLSKIINSKKPYSICYSKTTGSYGCYKVMGYSKKLYEFLNDEIQIELVINKYPSSFVKGFFDSEGSIDPKRIRLWNTSIELLTKITKALDLLEIRYTWNKRENILKKRENGCHCIYVRKESYNDFIQKVGEKYVN